MLKFIGPFVLLRKCNIILSILLSYNKDIDKIFVQIKRIFGGIIDGKFAFKRKPKHLKTVFAYSNWLAALFMIISAFHTKGMI
jgi:hypothetical protein